MENGKISDYITYPKTFEKYRWYNPLITVMLAAIIYLALCFISGEVILIAIGKESITGVFNQNLSSTSVASLIIYYFLGLMLPSLYLANRILRDRPFSSYCSSRGGWNWKTFFKCAAIALAVYVIITAMEMILTNSFEIENRMSLAFIIAAVIVVPLQSMAEEFAFRGFLMQTLGSWFNIPVLALAIPAIAFTLIHGYNSIGQIAILLSGIIYGFLTWKSNGLEASSAMHSVNNLFAVLMEGLILTEPSSAVSIESLIIDIITQITIAALLYYIGKRNGWFT